MRAATRALFQRRFRSKVGVGGRRVAYHRPLRGERLEARDLLAQTVGLFENDPQSFGGYTLFAPSASGTTYLINNEGEAVHTWQSVYPPMSAYLLDDGSLIRAGRLPATPIFAPGASGRIERFDWAGNLIWEYQLSNDQYQLHHDFTVLPNGNVLMIAWEKKTAAQAVAAGRNPGTLQDENNNELWPDMIIEVRPTGASGGEIVWEWHLWDHLVQDYDSSQANFGVVANHPELADLNFVPTGEGAGAILADWTHFNGIDYNAELDQVIVSSREFSEFWIIDHSTTTAEAAGHTGGRSGRGGDILYRWGNPQTYDRGTEADQVFAYQHNAQWIKDGLPGEGNLLVFNNGWNRPDGDYSSIDELTPPLKHQWRLYNGTDLASQSPVTVDSVTIPEAWVPVTGDWNGDGRDTIGFYDPQNGDWYFNNKLDGSVDEVIAIQSGAVPATSIPLTGDWNGDGVDTFGFYNPQNGEWYFNNRLDGSVTDVVVFQIPSVPASWLPITGDWNGDGRDTVGLYDAAGSTWYFTNRLDGVVDDAVVVQIPAVPGSWLPVTGDWDGDDRASFGLYDAASSTWYLKNRLDGAVDDVVVVQGVAASPSWNPVTGDWDGNGSDTVGWQDPTYAPGTYTIEPGKPFGPAGLSWTYRSTPQDQFFAAIISGAQRLPNGNTFINEGTEGRFFEVTPAGETVWEYLSPVVAGGPLSQGDPVPVANVGIPGVYQNFVFRANRYASNYAGLAGQDLTPKGPIEHYLFDEMPGFYDRDNQVWYLFNSTDGSANNPIVFDASPVPTTSIPVTGDWDGDGRDTPGFYDPQTSQWRLYASVNGSFGSPIVVQLPAVPASWVPVVGDWDGNGQDTIGLYDAENFTWYFKNQLNGSTDDVVVVQTVPVPPSWIPLTGDWNGDGHDTFGLYDPANYTWYFKNNLDGSVGDVVVITTLPVPGSWVPVTGDWNGDGYDTAGLYDPENFKWYFNNHVDGSVGDVFVIRTAPVPASWKPVTGDWDGSPAAAAQFAGESFAAGTPSKDDSQAATLTVDQLATSSSERREDVDRDGLVTPRDALVVINYLIGAHDSATLSQFLPDVSGDGIVSPLDALLVINLLNGMLNPDSGAGSDPAAGDPVDGQPSEGDTGPPGSDTTPPENGVPALFIAAHRLLGNEWPWKETTRDELIAAFERLGLLLPEVEALLPDLAADVAQTP